MFTKIIKNYLLFAILALLSNPVFSTPEQSVTEGEVSRALFTSAVHNREPIDQLNVLSELISEVFFFTEFRNYQGHTLTHQWSHNSKISHNIPFEVKGKRWRVFSSKTFVAGAKQEGTWTVKVLDEAGNVLSENSIDYIRPSTDDEILAGKEASEAAAAKQTDQDSEKTSESTTSNTTANPDEKDDAVETKSEDKSEASSEDKPDTSSEDKPNTSPEDKPDTSPEEKPDTSPDDKPDTSPDDKPDTSPDDKPNTSSDDKPNTSSDDKPNTSSDDKPNTSSDDKPNTSPEDKPNTSSEDKADKPIWDNIK